MGQPAARLGDTTAHGGVIILGCPTVLIGGMPAARMGDMHVCPMLTPGVPPIPHVGGPIVKGSPTVLIGGMPAARVSDMCTCVGPPDTIAMGCATVLIGEAGSGSASAGAGKGSGSKAKGDEDTGKKSSKSIAAAGSGGPQKEKDKSHYLDVKFTDKAGYPITGVKYKITSPKSEVSTGAVSGGIKSRGIEAGSYKIELRAITNAQWLTGEAKVGEKVKLTADVAGFDDGTPATITIFERDFNKADDLVEKIADAKVSGGKVEADWEYRLVDDEDDVAGEREKKQGFSSPEYYFMVDVEGCQGRSGMLYFKDWIEIEMDEEDGVAVADEEYTMILPNGEVRKGKLDSNGYAREDNVPPGKVEVRFPQSGGELWINDDSANDKKQADD